MFTLKEKEEEKYRQRVSSYWSIGCWYMESHNLAHKGCSNKGLALGI
jgi:hypothetical protein